MRPSNHPTLRNSFNGAATDAQQRMQSQRNPLATNGEIAAPQEPTNHANLWSAARESCGMAMAAHPKFQGKVCNDQGYGGK